MGFLTLEQLYEKTDVAWVIEGVLPANAVSAVYGDTQSGKSFLMVDWACCVLTGTAWMGRPAKQGPVLYIATEDANDFKRRFQGWEMEHGSLAGVSLHFEDEGVQLLSEQSVKAVITELERLTEQPALIIIDTYGKGIVDGMRSNDGDKDRTEINRTLRSAEQIRRAAAPGAALVLVSHTTKDGNREAGSAAFSQGVHMLAKLSGTAQPRATLTLTCHKLKTGSFEPIALHCNEITMSDATTSLVFQRGAQDVTKPKPRARKKGPSKETRAVRRQKILDCHLKGMTSVAIGEKLAMNDNTVRGILHQARKSGELPAA